LIGDADALALRPNIPLHRIRRHAARRWTLTFGGAIVPTPLPSSAAAEPNQGSRSPGRVRFGRHLGV